MKRIDELKIIAKAEKILNSSKPEDCNTREKMEAELDALPLTFSMWLNIEFQNT